MRIESIRRSTITECLAYEITIISSALDAQTHEGVEHTCITRLGEGQYTIDKSLEYLNLMGLNVTKGSLIQLLLVYSERILKNWLGKCGYLPIPWEVFTVDVLGDEAPEDFKILVDVAHYIPYALPLDMLLTNILQTELARWVVKSSSGKVSLYQLPE